ncbi:MAG: hypothetical protein Rubg2KO_17970 [Rubricoccaceae bacterium]
MNDQWRNEKRGDFGWSVEGSTEIKALWLAQADFADPAATASGKISEATGKALEQKLAEHAAEITPKPTLDSALHSGALTAFAIADDVGGGYLIVLAVGLMSFETIATEGGSSVQTTATQAAPARNSLSSTGPATATDSAIVSWFKRIFLVGPVAKLASRLARNDDATFVSALEEAVQYAPQGNDLGIRAMEEAMRWRAGERQLDFHQPGLGTERVSIELGDPVVLLSKLVSVHGLLHDPRISQILISAVYASNGAVGVGMLISGLTHTGGAAQGYALQLLYNHLLQTEELAQARERA